MNLPRLRLRAGAHLQRVLEVVDLQTGAIGPDLKRLLARMTKEELASIKEDLGLVWDQFSPDAAYVFVSREGQLGLAFEDENALFRWWDEIDAAIAEAKGN